MDLRVLQQMELNLISSLSQIFHEINLFYSRVHLGLINLVIFSHYFIWVFKAQLALFLLRA